jgi:hypothetical protein
MMGLNRFMGEPVQSLVTFLAQPDWLRRLRQPA